MKVKKWIDDNIQFLDENTILKAKINGSENSLDTINFSITNYMDIKYDFSNIFKRNIIKITAINKNYIEILC